MVKHGNEKFWGTYYGTFDIEDIIRWHLALRHHSRSDQRGLARVEYTGIRSGGYYILLESDNNENDWKAVHVTKDIIQRERPSQEILYVLASKDGRIYHTEPAFESVQASYSDKGGYKSSWECTLALNKYPGYSPCNSRLMKTEIGKSIGKNVFAAITTLGMASGSWKEIDVDKIRGIVAGINVNKILEQKSAKPESEREAERKASFERELEGK